MFIDFKGAFDNVSHEKLWNHLHMNRISTKFLLLLKKMYESSHIRITTTTNDRTDYVKLTKGLLQGDPVSPTLFNIFLNDAEIYLRSKGHRGVKISENEDIILLAYADDIVILSTSIIDLRDKITNLEEYCNEKQLIINTEKTNILIFKKRINKRLEQTFKIYNQQIQIVDKFKFLGITFYRIGSMQLELDCRVSAANMAMSKLDNIILRNKHVSWTTKTTLINSMIESVLLYGFFFFKKTPLLRMVWLLRS
jgi:hypothetical protein